MKFFKKLVVVPIIILTVLHYKLVDLFLRQDKLWDLNWRRCLFGNHLPFHIQ
jgi:hypothetical protein